MKKLLRVFDRQNIAYCDFLEKSLIRLPAAEKIINEMKKNKEIIDIKSYLYKVEIGKIIKKEEPNLELIN